MGYKSSGRKISRKVFPSIRRGDVLPLYHMSIVMNQIIWIHQETVMLWESKTFLVATFKISVHLIYELIYKN